MTEKLAVCFFCGKDVTQEDFCYGCKEYICEECCTNPDPPWGKHEVEDHQSEDEEIEEEKE